MSYPLPTALEYLKSSALDMDGRLAGFIGLEKQQTGGAAAGLVAVICSLLACFLASKILVRCQLSFKLARLGYTVPSVR